MSLDRVSLNINLAWLMSKTNTGFGDTSEGPDSKAWSTSGIDVAVQNELYAQKYTIAASGTQTMDLSSFTNLLNQSKTLTSVLSLFLLPTGTNAICKLEPGAANPLTWFFSGTTPAISIPTGGVFVFSNPGTGTGQTVDGTHKNLLVTNTGSGSMSLTVLAVGSTL